MKPEKSTKHWFSRAIDVAGGIYETQHGIEIYAYPDDSFYLCCDHPEANVSDGEVKLGLCRPYADVDELMEALAITSKDDLDNLPPRMLLSRYKQGTIDICASLEEGNYVWDLTFRIKSSNTYITDHDTDEQLIWHAALLTSAGITRYVKEYAARHPLRLIATASFNLAKS